MLVVAFVPSTVRSRAPWISLVAAFQRPPSGKLGWNRRPVPDRAASTVQSFVLVRAGRMLFLFVTFQGHTIIANGAWIFFPLPLVVPVDFVSPSPSSLCKCDYNLEYFTMLYVCVCAFINRTACVAFYFCEYFISFFFSFLSTVHLVYLFAFTFSNRLILIEQSWIIAM